MEKIKNPIEEGQGCNINNNRIKIFKGGENGSI